MKRVLFLLAMLYGGAQLSIVKCQLSVDMDEVQVTAHRRLKDTGVQQTRLDTSVLHQNIALSMSDILTQHSTLFIKSYGRSTESTAVIGAKFLE